MKKNILTIIILAATLINLTLTAVTLFIVIPNTKQTDSLITKILQVVDLELESPIPTEEKVINIEDLENYALNENEDIYVVLNKEAGATKQHHLVFKAALSINAKSEDYVKLNPLIATQEDRIIEIIQDEIDNFTIDDVMENKEVIKQNALLKIQEMFQSDFIVGITFSQFLSE